MNSEAGFSFQQFLDYIEAHGVWNCDVHIKPQFRQRERALPPTRFINISKTDLFSGLNDFEAELGLTQTRFAEMSWLHDLEGTRKAAQNPVEGEAIDEMAFNRAQVKDQGYFPSYDQLLTPRARARIEAIYKADFDAYRDYL